MNDKAIADLTMAGQINPENGWWYFYRAKIYLDNGQYSLASSDQTRAAELMKKES